MATYSRSGLRCIQEGLQELVKGYKDGVIAKSSTSATEEETNLAFR